MRPSHLCYGLIQRFEGFSTEIYRCVAGCETIGYGHRLKKGEAYPDGITADIAYELLRQDVSDAARAVERLLPLPLNQFQHDALVSFTFNLGAGVLQRSTLRQVIIRKEFTLAPDEFRKWVYAGGRKLSGLMHRREAEIAVFTMSNN